VGNESQGSSPGSFKFLTTIKGEQKSYQETFRSALSGMESGKAGNFNVFVALK
jgi:hypothetical protein